jgi:regulator of protease activity HflC (stomatin/prohibitin superfamily)
MNWLATLFEFLEKFWPFCVVETGERGVVYIMGRVRRRTLPPFIYFYLPFFTEIVSVSVLPRPFSTPLLNITLSDTKTLSYSVTAIGRVSDPVKALTEIDDYEESFIELLPSRTSEKLAEVDAARLDYTGRKRLLSDLLRWVNEDTNEYGLTVDAVRFTNFAVNQRAYRLLVDTALPALEF